MDLASALLTDLYQITMAQGYWESGKQDTQACFHMFFRDYPFDGGYAIACGMSQLCDLVDGFGFSDEDRRYLSTLEAPGGGKLFKEEFLDYLCSMHLVLDIDAVYEGTVVFPYEPIVRVCGPIMQCQLIETALLNCINFQTLVATKASRVCYAAETPVAEFGLRRAQGACGGVWASRAAIVGGCVSTSNVLAGQLFNVPVSGTHAHSWVMSFESELEAFRAYAKAFPNNCILLVDTYDVDTGIKNAITVGLEMRKRGERLLGIRIDSGDLSWLAKKAREMLDEAGLQDCGVVLSNDLDEYSIQCIRSEGTPVMSWGVGTKLATCFDQPSLGGVFKLSATRRSVEDEWKDHLKISESKAKLMMPGMLDIRRYYFNSGKLAGDMVFDINTEVNEKEVIVDPLDGMRRKTLSSLRFETLLQPLARSGKVVLSGSCRDTLHARARSQEGLESLDESQKRIRYPHTYPVGLEKNLHMRREKLVAEYRDIS